MAGGQTVALADERISWKVPLLFANDWLGLSLAHALNPLLSRPLFSVAYGCPSCAWAGGRRSCVTERLTEREARRYFEAYRAVGARCALTFSRPDAGDFLGDPYCAMLLSLADEYGGQAIVVDERLARHIRRLYPSVWLVASNNRCILDHTRGFGGLDEESYYRQLLESYDEVVVRCEALLEGGMADQLVDVADHIQLIVNQKCVANCPDAPNHIARVAQSIRRQAAGGTYELAGCTQPLRGISGTLYVEPERRRALADKGYTSFKLEGRGAPAAGAFRMLTGNILRDGTQVAGLELLAPLVDECLVLDLLGTPAAEATRVPDDLLCASTGQGAVGGNDAA